MSAQAAAFARSLLLLAQSGERAELRIYTERGGCRALIEGGVLLSVGALVGCDESVGDVLLRRGDLDSARHEAALQAEGCAPLRPVGAWLVAERLATPGALAHALRAQLRARVLAVLACADVSFARAALQAGDGALQAPPLPEPPHVADVLLGCMRSLGGTVLGGSEVRGEPSLNARGRFVLEHAALWPEEEALAALLLRDARARRGGEVQRLCRAHPRAGALLAWLEQLGGLERAAQATASAGQTYRLLARKRQQIRSGDSPYHLLDLAPGAPVEEARRALRRFAGQLHPDALGPDVPDALRRASTEVMRALADAERAVRSGSVPPMV